MKFTESIVSMVGDFAAMKRTPDYKPSTVLMDRELEERKQVEEELPKQSQLRRHSLLISVGTQELPKLGRQRSESVASAPTQLIDAKIYNKANRRQSAPCISTGAASASLKKKLQKLREERGPDSDEDTLKEEDEEQVAAENPSHRRMSVSYRI